MSPTTLDSPPQAATQVESPAAPFPPKPGWFVSALRWVWTGIPTALVLVVLAGIAAWGHSTNWKLPKFSSLAGTESAPTAAWCDEHNVAEVQCIECNPKLVPAGPDFGWCKRHGVAQCPFEHPEIAQAALPSTVTAEMLEEADRALAVMPRPENNSVCKLHERRIQFASAEAVEKAGVDIALVQQRPIVESILANGEVVYDETQTAHLASRVQGTVWRVEKQVGDAVKLGEVLALIEAAEIGQAKGVLLEAITQIRLRQANYDRLRPLAESDTVEGKRLLEARSALEEGRIQLLAAQQALINLGLTVRADDYLDLESTEIAAQIQFLGLPPELVASLDPGSTTSNLFPLRSPLEGVVVERTVVPGEVVDNATTLFTVSDLTRMWLTLNVRHEDVHRVERGQAVAFESSESRDSPEITGTVSWISTAADDRTRTVEVRVELPNSDGRLLAHTFGEGRIVLREAPRAFVVPSEAVHWDGCCHVVFVRDRAYLKEGAVKFFHVRKVRLGVKDGDTTEIIAGLLPREVIAAKNSVVLEAQLLKGNLGAGCCEIPLAAKSRTAS